jgi:formate C-acetyltransferase
MLESIRAQLLNEPDTVCFERARLVTDFYRANDGLPVPLLRSGAFAHVLANMTLDLESNPFFAGNTSTSPRAWMTVPEHGFSAPGQALIENPRVSDLFERYPPPADIADYWRSRSTGAAAAIGHLAVELARVVNGGLESVLEEFAHLPQAPTEQQRQYREAMEQGCRAVIAWSARYAKAAAQAADKATNPALAQAHRRVAAACLNVPARPASDLFEALQSIVLVHFALHIEGHGYSVSLGLLDRMLARFEPQVLADPDAAADLIAAFLLKLSAISVFGNHSKTQAITIGGGRPDGTGACNAVTLAVLEAFDRIRVSDPHVFLRWRQDLPRSLRDKAASMLLGGMSMPQFIGDKTTISGLESLGVSPADAAEYCVIGCSELGVPGRLYDSAIGPKLAYAEIVRNAALEWASRGDVDIAALEACIERHMEARLTEVLANQVRWLRSCSQRAPCPLTSALMRGGPERGEDFHFSMPYSAPGLYERGFTNAINSLAAIEHTLAVERSVSPRELKDAIENNFPDPRVAGLLRKAPKWGNDDDRADRWALRLLDMRQRVLARVQELLGDKRPRAAVHVVRSLHHLDGRGLGATPDGRRSGEPLVDSIGPLTGSAAQGPADALCSVLKIDAARYYRGGYNLNLTLLRAQTTPQALWGLLDAFFAQGGQEIQVNCLDAALLRDAVRRPDQHADLVVRVAGYNAVFVKLSSVAQQELLARAEAAGGR